MNTKMPFRLALLFLLTAVNLAFTSQTTKLAEKALEAGDYAKAVELYTRLIEEKPSDRFYLSLGHAYYKLQEFQRAIQAYSAAIDLQKDSPEGHSFRCLASAQYSRQLYTDAMLSYHRAFVIEPVPSDNLWIARCFANVNQWAQARAAVLKYLDHSPLDTAGLELLAHIHLNTSNADEAVTILRQIVDSNPTSRHYLIGLANAQTVTNRFDEAIDTLEYTLRTIAPDDLAAIQMLADLYMSQEMFAQATNVYRLVTTLKSTPSQEDYYRLGYAAMRSNQAVTAQNAFLAAIKLSPNHYDSHLCLAQIALQQFQFDKAHQHYLSAVSANPTSPEPHGFIADFQMRQKNYTLAAQYYAKALSLDRNQPESYYNCVLALLKTDQYTRARDTLKKALAEYPDHPGLNNLLDQLVAL
ncbi:MAG: tetratricopeptide repeat protein [Phycisphaerae bacterium]|nr:tetratricopeptide repeat protein [Phycisphaerae bacterium]